MFKYILRLVAASASLVALLLVTHPAIAATSVDNSLDRFGSASVSLNVVSPSLQLNNDSDILLQHFGCSCGACMQIEQSERQI